MPGRAPTIQHISGGAKLEKVASTAMMLCTKSLLITTVRRGCDQVCAESLGSGMLVLLLLDFGRLMCGIELRIAGQGYYLYNPQQ